MCDEKKINPADLNGDGKVAFMEQVQYTAGQAKAKAEELAGKVKEEISGRGRAASGII